MASEDTGITTSGDRTIGEKDQFDSELSREDAAFSSVHTGSRSDFDLTLFRPEDDGAAIAPTDLAVPERGPDATVELLHAMAPESAPSGAGPTGAGPAPSDDDLSVEIAALTVNPALSTYDAGIAPVTGSAVGLGAVSGFRSPTVDGSAVAVVSDTGPVDGGQDVSHADPDSPAGGGDTIDVPDPVDHGTPDAPGGGQTDGPPHPVAPHPPADTDHVPDDGAPTGNAGSEDGGAGSVGGAPVSPDPSPAAENPADGVPNEGSPAGPDGAETGAPGTGNTEPDGAVPVDTGSVSEGDADGGATNIPGGTDQPQDGAAPVPTGGNADEAAQPGAPDGGLVPAGDGADASNGPVDAPADGSPAGDDAPESDSSRDAASGGGDAPGDGHAGDGARGEGPGNSVGAGTPESDLPPSDGLTPPAEDAAPVTEPGSTDGGNAADGSGVVPGDIHGTPSPVAGGAEDDADAESGNGPLDGDDDIADGSAPGGSTESGDRVEEGETDVPAQNPVAGDDSGPQADGDGAAADAGSETGNEATPDVTDEGEGPSEGETGLPGGAATGDAGPDDGATGVPGGDGPDSPVNDGAPDGGQSNPGTGGDDGEEPVAPADPDEPVHSGGGTGSADPEIVPHQNEAADPGEVEPSGADDAQAGAETPGGGASPSDPVAEEPAPAEDAPPADGPDRPGSAPILSALPAAGAEDTPVPIEITIDAKAMPGIEAVTLSGIPAGTTFSAGTDTGGGTWTVAATDLGDLHMTPPQDFAGDFTLGAQVVLAGGTRGESVVLPVSLAPVADGPLLTVGLTELARPVVVSAAWSTPGTIAGPRPTYLDSGNVNTGKANDVVIVKGDLADKSNIHLGAGDDLLAIGGHFEGRSHLNGGTGTDRVELGLPSSNFEIINLVQTQGRIHGKLTDLTTGGDIVINHVESIVFGDGLVIGAAKGPRPNVFEPGTRTFDVDIAASLTDTDGSESLSVAATSLPEGALLSAGSQDGSGAWQLSLDDLGDLTMTLAPGHTGPVAIEVTATAREIDVPGETASVVARVTPGQTAHGAAVDIADLAHVEVRLADAQPVFGPQATAATLALDELVTAALSEPAALPGDGAAFGLGDAAQAFDLWIDDFDDLPSLLDAMA